MTDAAVAGQTKANQTSANVCSDTCATLGLGGVTAAVQGVWAKVSRTAFLGCVCAAVLGRVRCRDSAELRARNHAVRASTLERCCAAALRACPATGVTA